MPTIGLVPTMGALHDGHESLIKQSVSENDQTIVSIFVNPVQFAEHEDYDTYPTPRQADINRVNQFSNTSILMPSITDIYPNGIEGATRIRIPLLDQHWCSVTRPHFFEGVCTVVLHLFLKIRPTTAYFGEKDYQQLAIINHMVSDLFLPISIKSCPIIREPDGLAMSSRNQYLSDQDRSQAGILYETIQIALSLVNHGIRDISAIVNACKKHILTAPNAQIDYIGIADASTLSPCYDTLKSGDRLMLAIIIGNTRLIDNAQLVE